MQPLSADDVLRIWEAARRLPPPERDAAILGDALPDLPPRERDALLLGEQQTLLFRLHSLTFGSELDAHARCSGCGEPLEFRLDLSPLATPPPTPVPAAAGLMVDPFEVRVRPLVVGDVREAAACADPADARRLLGERAVLSASAGGEEVRPTHLPEEVIAGIADALAALDVRAEVLVTLDCPACGAAVPTVLDAGELLWSEVRALATRLLEEVHALARAYGWSEREILALSPARRAAYLALAGG